MVLPLVGHRNHPSGQDLIVQSKSGTGKTCVFAIAAIEAVDLSAKTIQAFVLAPTREIAVQIREEVVKLSLCCKEKDRIRCHAFIGGMPIRTDKANLAMGCHVVVGTPGRLRELLTEKWIDVSSVSLLILDEVDQLVAPSFWKDVKWLCDAQPKSKRVSHQFFLS
jgi:superfamily II DNA/RNA helicase